MAARDDKNGKQASTDELLTNGIHRRSFLKFLAGTFALAALPEVESCHSGVETELQVESVSFAGVPMTWVTRKEDGLSLGFQFVNCGSDPSGSGNLVVSSGSTAAIAITFPPQHVMEDAVGTPPPGYTPLDAVASGTSRLVFQVPSTYGAGGVGPFPYTLQGVLELCSVCSPVLPNNSKVAIPPVLTAEMIIEEPVDLRYESLSQARIDRVIARVDPQAAARVRRRAIHAARMLNRPVRQTGPIQPLAQNGNITGTLPLMPLSSETSIELPFRVLMAPDADSISGWSFMSAPVISPDISGQSVDGSRAELWHARMEGQSLRALYTRDWDLPTPPGVNTSYGKYNNTPIPAGTSTDDLVQHPNPSELNRQALVLQSGDMSQAAAPPALNVNQLVLSPAGGTMDAWADWTNFPLIQGKCPPGTALVVWKQKTALGRDDYTETATPCTVLPGGFPAVLTIINKRCEDPATGTVGTVYQTAYLTITNPLVSLGQTQNGPKQNCSDYRTFPFVALEITNTKIPLWTTFANTFLTTADASTWAIDPNQNQVQVGMIGTDWKGNSIRFTTPLWVAMNTTRAGTAAYLGWNHNEVFWQFDGQRIAYAPPSDGSGAASCLPASGAASSYSVDSTSYETTSMDTAMKAPTGNSTPLPADVVPYASSFVLAVEAVRHLQSPPPPVTTGTYTYDSVYAASGFDTTANPNEIFLAFRSLTPSPNAPSIDFTLGTNSAQSGGLAAPAHSAQALSRATGMMGGPVGGPSPYTGFDPSTFFGTSNPMLFGVFPLKNIIQTVAGVASQYMPKAVTKALSNAEEFLEAAMSLYNLITSLADTSSSTSQIASILKQVAADATAYSQIAAGTPASGMGVAGGNYVAQGAPPTAAQLGEAAWMLSGVVQAQVIIEQFAGGLFSLVTDPSPTQKSAANQVATDITSLAFGSLLGLATTPPPPLGSAQGGSLGTFLTDITSLIEQLNTVLGTAPGAAPGPDTAAGAVMRYLGPVLKPLNDAMSRVNGFAGVLEQLITDLGYLKQGLDLAKNMSAELTWKPVIAGIGVGGFVAFIPSSNQAFSVDIRVRANASPGNPAGADITARMDSFAIAFGGNIPTVSPITAGTFTQSLQNADVSLVFDHMQVQMLAGQKPAVDIVFNDIYFGGDLAFVETLKNLIPLDAFGASHKPAAGTAPHSGASVSITTQQIQAGFTLAIPNVAVGMFSMQNLSLSATLKIPFITSPTGQGITFNFDFCTFDNPFVVTVAMLGGGGFFQMQMGMDGLEWVAMGIQVAAQLAISLAGVASGSVSIEVGIFLVYWEPSGLQFQAGGTPGTDPVTNQPDQPGWLIGGYLRLRGELDICGVVTISAELYLQITYSPNTGKCVGSGFIAVDISLFFFSLNTQLPFSRQFAGSNGDPTFAQMMSAGPEIDPMMDPTLASGSPFQWNPFAEYCMAFANA